MPKATVQFCSMITIASLSRGCTSMVRRRNMLACFQQKPRNESRLARLKISSRLRHNCAQRWLSTSKREGLGMHDLLDSYTIIWVSRILRPGFCGFCVLRIFLDPDFSSLHR